MIANIKAKYVIEIKSIGNAKKTGLARIILGDSDYSNESNYKIKRYYKKDK